MKKSTTKKKRFRPTLRDHKAMEVALGEAIAQAQGNKVFTEEAVALLKACHQRLNEAAEKGRQLEDRITRRDDEIERLKRERDAARALFSDLIRANGMSMVAKPQIIHWRVQLPADL